MLKIIYAILILTISCQSKGQIQEIEIYAVESDMTTTFRIECSNFEKYLSDEITKKVLTKKNDIQNFQFALKNAEKTGSVSIDTRARVLIRDLSKHKVDTLCADSFHIYYKGSYFKMSEGLSKIIWSPQK